MYGTSIYVQLVMVLGLKHTGLISKMYKVPSFCLDGFKMCHCTFLLFLSRRILHAIVFNFNEYHLLVLLILHN